MVEFLEDFQVNQKLSDEEFSYENFIKKFLMFIDFIYKNFLEE